MASFRLKNFTFTPDDEGGVDITAHAGTHIARLHVTEEELFELLGFLGLSADEVEKDPFDVDDRDMIPDRMSEMED